MSLESRLLALVQAIGADIKSLINNKADINHTHSAATTSAAGFMSAADKTKLDGVAASANNYVHPTGDGNLHVPATGTTNNGKVLMAGSTAGSISWAALPADSVTSVAGKTGAVTLAKADVGLGNVDNTPDASKPISTAVSTALAGKSDTSHTHSAATTTAAGFMSATDKTKLDGVAASANNYVHPTGDGNLHVPATGTTNNGKVLMAGSTAGSISWAALPADSVTSVAGKTGAVTLAKADVGLGNVDNTPDASKPISTAVSTALAGKSDTSHTHSAATTTAAGFMSATDKTKLDGVAASANNYVHPTGDGNLHVPATGTTNNGKVLMAGSTAGSISWAAIPAASASLSGVVTTGTQTFAGAKTFSSDVTCTSGKFNSTASYVYLTVNGSNSFAANNTDAVVISAFRNASDNAGTLGTYANRWSAIYAVTGTISTSDARQKAQIEDSPLGLDFVKDLRPVKYKWKVAENIVDTEKSSVDSVVYSGFRPGVRDHYGLIAQEVEAALGGRDFAGLVIDENGNYGLRYEQFISVLIKAVQELDAKIKKLEEGYSE